MKITHAQIVAAEEVAGDVYDGNLTVAEGSVRLALVHGMNASSARDYICDYRCMMQGRVFHRAMSAPAVDHFLSRIREVRGEVFHALAISAVAQHIDYYEGVRGRGLKILRDVVDKHRQVGSAIDFVGYFAAFEESVRDSMRDSAQNRRSRLSKAPKLPFKVALFTYTFARNPDVVAEVLVRANGVCEGCKGPAPFIKKRNLEPYLEVHHKKPLSEGGEDAVENAEALCPNCHRHRHFGV